MQRTGHTSGFTLIEMLSTIAIITILTGVVLINFSDIRKKANTRDAETTMNSARSAVALCVLRNTNLNQPTPLVSPTNLTCPGASLKWPDIGRLAPGWSYVAAGFEGDVSDRAFTFSATDGTNTITCTEGACTKT